MTHKLFIPGPVNVSKDVLLKMATPLIGHRSKDASILQKSISEKMKTLMHTNNEILLSTSSGSGLMEASVRSCTRNRAAIFSVGAFGHKWYEMAIANGITADLFSSELGKPTSPKQVDEVLSTGKYDLITITHNETSTGIMNPMEEISQVIKKYPEVIFCLDTVSSLGGVNINVDDLGVDICIASTQKCLGLPPGMSICSISQKAIEAAKKVKNRGFYLDLLKLYEYIQKKDYQYHSTPSLSHMFALDYQLDKILKEGLENRFTRHKQMANYVQQWAKENFDLFADEDYASYTVTTIKNTKNISVAQLNEKLSEYGYVISNGYGNLKEKTFRIGHMAETTLEEIQTLLSIIEKIIK
ncbi:pyridoxal-phosphate-dependent aminotransferase family protein [Anaerophilus nitritogenes]|uniref:pyridoxal-phosphate-dependent aminotransferase family protein n=1 Tax=Anaerophilus nitritogenes TaxID=2498136 RepID=UPI00101DA951|nr:alanine--glyoxylate aminotransferase family protein [Anaerophilus nitritogenes]